MVRGGHVIDLALLEIAEEAQKDKDYMELMKLIVEGKHPKVLAHTHPNREYSPVFESLSVEDSPNGCIILMDGIKILIPKNSRPKMLNLLHSYHSSLEQLTTQGTNRWFWPTIKNEISNMWATCQVCQENRPLKTKEVPIKTMVLDLHPIESLNTDFCQHGNSYYIIAADRYSGYL